MLIGDIHSSNGLRERNPVLAASKPRLLKRRWRVFLHVLLRQFALAIQEIAGVAVAASRTIDRLVHDDKAAPVRGIRHIGDKHAPVRHG